MNGDNELRDAVIKMGKDIEYIKKGVEKIDQTDQRQWIGINKNEKDISNHKIEMEGKVKSVKTEAKLEAKLMGAKVSAVITFIGIIATLLGIIWKLEAISKVLG